MAHLYVSVRLYDSVVDQRLVAVQDEVWLGDAPDAVVPFPGRCIRVRRLGSRLQIQGRWLNPGRQVVLRAGPIEVGLEAVLPRRTQTPRDWLPDGRLFLATAAIVLFGAWWETTQGFLSANPAAAARMQALIAEVPLAAGLAPFQGEEDDAPADAEGADEAPTGHMGTTADRGWPPPARFAPE